MDSHHVSTFLTFQTPLTFTVTTGGTQPQPDNTNDSEMATLMYRCFTVFAGTPALTETNVIDIRKNDGDKITGLAVFQDVLIVFKERSIYQVTFDSSGNPTVTPITYATGCVSHKSIVNVENDVYFMSREVCVYFGNEPQFFLCYPYTSALDSCSANHRRNC